MSAKIKAFLGAALVVAFLSACAVGPDYHPPDTRSPDEFVPVEGAQFSSADVEREFWKSFNDPQLNDLVESALAANHDIRIAVAGCARRAHCAAKPDSTSRRR